MAKQSSKSVPAVKYEIGARVAALLPTISDEPLIGTVEQVSGKGWYKIRLDDEEFDAVGVKDGCVSALARSMAAHVDVEEADENLDEGDDSGDADSGDADSGDADSGDAGSGESDDADPDDAEESVGSKMSEALRKARTHYVKCKRPNGAATAHNGDGIAKALRDYEPLEVADMADKCLDLPIGTHQAKYGHLNNGQIRMNSGNRIRAAFLKALKEQDAETIKRISRLLDLDGCDEEETDDAE